jgi:ParB-like chromosome segregation protein Spo0J
MTRKFHPLAETVPSMTDEEYVELVADIRANGLREKITLYQDMILDGRHRYKACNATGRTAVFDTFEGTEAQARAFVISKNYHRRMVTAAKKRERIAELLKAQPELSDRAIGKMTKTDHKTVGAVRGEKEATGEIPHVDKRTDAKGRQQPARKKKPTAAAKKAAAEKAAATRRANDEAAAAENRRKREEEEDRVIAIVIRELELDDDKIALLYMACRKADLFAHYSWADCAAKRKLSPEAKERAQYYGDDFDGWLANRGKPLPAENKAA